MKRILLLLSVLSSCISIRPVTSADLPNPINPVSEAEGLWVLHHWECLDGEINPRKNTLLEDMNNQISNKEMHYELDLERKTGIFRKIGCQQNFTFSLAIENGRYKMVLEGGKANGCELPPKGFSRILEVRNDILYDFNPVSDYICASGYSVQAFKRKIAKE